MRKIVLVAAGVVLALVALLGVGLIGGVVGFAAGAFSGVAGTGGGAAQERLLSGEGPNKIVVIPVVGVISREGGGFLPFFGGGASSLGIIDQLDRAERDDAVKAVILELDTPGGGVVASDEVYRRIRARRTKKPVIALMTETAASGGYYIAAATNHIVAHEMTITGSIGVIVALLNTQDLDRKLGVRTVVFKSGAFKDMGSPDRSMTSAEAALFQQLVDEAYNRFVGAVAGGRNMSPAVVRRLADGRIYTGRQALRHKLVDSLGQMPDAIVVAKKAAGITEAQVVEYVHTGFWQSLVGSSRAGSAVGRVGRRLLGGMPESLVREQPFRVQYLMVATP
jgi:protease-4